MLTKSDDIIWRVVDEECVLLNTANGYYFSMNAIATEMWRLLDEGNSVDDVARTLAERYEIDPAEARRDVEELIAQLQHEKILE